MYRSHVLQGALALAVSLFSVSALAAPSGYAAEPLPNARFLAAAPFAFQSDREIFSRFTAEPSDSRIFSPRGRSRKTGQSPYQKDTSAGQAML